jgi:hypothetical protein
MQIRAPYSPSPPRPARAAESTQPLPMKTPSPPPRPAEEICRHPPPAPEPAPRPFIGRVGRRSDLHLRLRPPERRGELDPHRKEADPGQRNCPPRANDGENAATPTYPYPKLHRHLSSATSSRHGRPRGLGSGRTLEIWRWLL